MKITAFAYSGAKKYESNGAHLLPLYVVYVKQRDGLKHHIVVTFGGKRDSNHSFTKTFIDLGRPVFKLEAFD